MAEEDWFRSPVEEVSREDVALRWNVMMTQVFDFLFYGVFECMQQLPCIFHWQHYDQRSEAIHDQHKDSDDGLYLLGQVKPVMS